MFWNVMMLKMRFVNYQTVSRSKEKFFFSLENKTCITLISKLKASNNLNSRNNTSIETYLIKCNVTHRTE